jgi:hypothetical protein
MVLNGSESHRRRTLGCASRGDRSGRRRAAERRSIFPDDVNPAQQDRAAGGRRGSGDADYGSGRLSLQVADLVEACRVCGVEGEVFAAVHRDALLLAQFVVSVCSRTAAGWRSARRSSSAKASPGAGIVRISLCTRAAAPA